MAIYKYQALKNNNQIIEGEIEASSLREARLLIRNQGFIPAKIYSEDSNFEEHSPEVVQAKKTEKVLVKKLTLSQKIMFTSQLETLLSAGIPILEALESVESSVPDVKIKTICLNIRESIISGFTFAQSLEKLYSQVFGPVYIGLIKTGESAGELEATLQRMLVMLRKQDAIKGKIINASIYPAVLLFMMTALLILFSVFVFPRFASVMAFNGADLPFLAQMIVEASSFIGQFWWFVLMIIAAGIYTVVNMFKNPKIKSKWDEFILKVPAVSDFITYINLSNFMTVMHITYDAGVPIMSGIELANKTVGNYTIKSRIFKAISFMRSGKPISEAFQRAYAVPDALNSMISAGEKSGTLGKMFHDVAEVIDKKVDMALEAMTKLFEPAVIIIIGAAVLFIAIAFFQAYAGMLGSF